MKIVINAAYGGFKLSKEAYEFLGIPWDKFGYEYNDYDKRTDSKLIECVETLGAKASGDYAKLKVVEVPDDVEWKITDYDGWETVEEVHRRWH